jgi:hypothetical protein
MESDNDRSILPAAPRRASRRSLLGLLGLIAGSRAVATATATAAGTDTSPAAVTAEARLTLARSTIEVVRANVARGQFNPGERDPIYIWSQRRMEARFDLSTTKAERIAAAQEHFDEMKAAEELVNRVHAAGDTDRLDLVDAEYRRLEAASWLEREKSARS